MSPTASDSRSKTVDKKDVAPRRGAHKAPAERPHVAAAAAIDELLASEARASLRRTRDAQRDEPPKARIRVNVPPALIVAKPLQTAAWKAPFFSLALVVGSATFGNRSPSCAGKSPNYHRAQRAFAQRTQRNQPSNAWRRQM
jgi:hypothetical protein